MRRFSLLIILALVSNLIPVSLDVGSKQQPMFSRMTVPGLTDVPESMNGIAIADIDRDNYLDMVATFSPPWQKKDEPDKVRMFLNQGNYIYENHECTVDGNKTLTQSLDNNPQVPILADFNKDGWLDLFVSGHKKFDRKFVNQGNRLLISDGGFDRFKDVTDKMKAANLGGCNIQPSVGDVNKDGWLDFTIGCDVYGKPANEGSQFSEFFQFQYDPESKKYEDNVFEEYGLRRRYEMNFEGTELAGGGPMFSMADFNRDNALDLLQTYYLNMNNTSPTDEESIRYRRQGVKFWFNHYRDSDWYSLNPKIWWPINYMKDYKIIEKNIPSVPFHSIQDVDNDGLEDILAVGAHGYGEDELRVLFLKNAGIFKFEDWTKKIGLSDFSRTYAEWFKFQGFPHIENDKKEDEIFFKSRAYGSDAVFGDFDNDGWVDVLLCDGNQNKEHGKDLRNVLYMNNGDGTFTAKNQDFSGIDVNSFTAETADLNNDGMLDLVFCSCPEEPLPSYEDYGWLMSERYKSYVFTNKSQNLNNWVRFKFSNIDDARLIGAKVELFDSRTFKSTRERLLGLRTIMPSHNFRSATPLEAHFGLGRHNIGVSMRISLLDGTVAEYESVFVNGYFNVDMRSKKIYKIETGKHTDGSKPNIVVIQLDQTNMRQDAFNSCTSINDRFINKGVSWMDYIVADPRPDQSTASFLTGRATHNYDPATFDSDADRLNCLLQKCGYQTGFFGKYPFTETRKPESFPQGWTEWVSPVGGSPQTNLNYTLNENGELKAYGDSQNNYLTDVCGKKACDFIGKSADDDRPFFTFISLYSPGISPSPAQRHMKEFPTMVAPKPANFNEADVSDKPSFIGNLPLLDKKAVEGIDENYRLRMQSLKSIDEMIDNIFKSLVSKRVLGQTYVFLIANSGFHAGNHRLGIGSGTAYNEDVCLPFYAFGPEISSGRRIKGRLASNIDFMPTILEIVGMRPNSHMDGRSLYPILTSIATPQKWRQQCLLSSSQDNSKAGFLGLRSVEWSFVKYDTGELEYYNLAKDYFQLDNIAGKLSKDRITELTELAKDLATSAGDEFRKIEETF